MLPINVIIGRITIHSRNKGFASLACLSYNCLLARTFSGFTSYSPINHIFLTYELSKNKQLVTRKLHLRHGWQQRDINDLIVLAADGSNKLLRIHGQHGGKFSILNWATFMNRLGKFKKKHMVNFKKDKRYKKAMEQMTGIFSSKSLREISNIRGVANIVQSLAKLDEPITIIFDKIEEEAEYIVNNGEPRHFSIIAWSCAALNIPAPTFFNLLENHTSKTINLWNIQDISNTAWAYAKLSIPAPNFVKFIDENASGIIKDDAKPQIISKIAWSCATLSIPATNFFKLIDQNASIIISDKTKVISNTAWSFAKLSILAPNFFKLVDENASLIIDNGTIQEISNVAWAFETLSISSPNFSKLMDEKKREKKRTEKSSKAKNAQDGVIS